MNLLSSQPGPVGSAAPLPTPTASASTTAIEGGRIPTPTSPGYPSPPPGAIVLAREAGTSALALAVVPGGARPLTRVSVVERPGDGAERASGVGGGHRARPVRRRLLPGARAGAAARGHGARLARREELRLELPPSLDLRSGAGDDGAGDPRVEDLRTLVWHERLAASPTDALYTVYRAVAPDQLAYTISRRSSSIIIGTKRWDRPTPTAPWVESPQLPPIRQPQPFWASVTNARVLGEVTVGDKPAWVISFFDPVTPAWFEARVEKSTGRTLILDMTAVAHFMHHVYGPFDAPFELHPPPTA